jgi:UDP-2-acetamido-2,6-beta-L-arabino-hexul-4-ose reductase
MKKILITGSNGFIGKNLITHLKEKNNIEVIPFDKESSIDVIRDNLGSLDFIFHLAGVNRPKENKEFYSGNQGLTETICEWIRKVDRKIPILFTSSIQAELDNDYGKSKKAAEESLKLLKKEKDNPVFIYRLPNVFGKWCRPNYNSVVATFCYNISHSLPIQINDPDKELNLVYVDDIITEFLQVLYLDNYFDNKIYYEVTNSYKISLQEIADLLHSFKNSRENLITEKVGIGFVRALYSTYLSYLEPKDFSYKIPEYKDNRGVFSEMLKTKDSGQISFFTAYPGITRGRHYHHTKNEKFLVVKGKARFCFRHIVTGETYTIYTSSETPEIVETIPGWAHDITNIGEEEMIVLLWANEIFDRNKPDTYSSIVI